MSWLLYVFKRSSEMNYSPLPFRTWPLLHCCSYFKGSSFTKVTMLPLWACSHMDLCHTAQFIVAHILCVGWIIIIKKKKRSQRSTKKTFRVKAAATDFAALLKDNNSSDSYRIASRFDLQLPNFSGQACASIGKSSRCMGHSAWMVNLREADGRGVVHQRPWHCDANQQNTVFIFPTSWSYFVLCFSRHSNGLRTPPYVRLWKTELRADIVLFSPDHKPLAVMSAQLDDHMRKKNKSFFKIWPHGWAIKRAPDVNTTHIISLIHV